MKYIGTFLTVFLMISGLSAQELGAGFKIGFTLSQFDGPSEMAMGQSLESYEPINGFAIGGSISLKMSSLWGFTGEILYNQRGTDYTYDGPSYYIFDRGTPDQLIAVGNRKTDLQISNAYIEIPLSIYIEPVKRVKISAGPYAGFLVNATAGGDLTFTDGQAGNAGVDEFTIALDYNFGRDEVGIGEDDETQMVRVGGEFRRVPETADAYFLFEENRDGSTYKTLDYGIQTGLSVTISRGIYLGARYSHGLADISDEDLNVSKKEIESDGNFISLDEKDTNRSWQFFFGFSF